MYIRSKFIFRFVLCVFIYGENLKTNLEQVYINVIGVSIMTSFYKVLSSRETVFFKRQELLEDVQLLIAAAINPDKVEWNKEVSGFLEKTSLYFRGDIHGNLLDCVRDLYGLRLIDKDGHWLGGNKKMVFLGDYVHEGANSKEVVVYLRALKKEAQSSGGDVELKIGNHDLAHIQNRPEHRSLFKGQRASDEDDAHFTEEEVDELKEMFRTGVLNGEFEGSGYYEVGGHKLFASHGGLADVARDKLFEDEGFFVRTESDRSGDVSSILINNKLLRDVSKYNSTHEYDQVGRRTLSDDSFYQPDVLRGGDEEYGGPYWCSLERLALNKESDVIQIVAHTPTYGSAKLVDESGKKARSENTHILYDKKRGIILCDTHTSAHSILGVGRDGELKEINSGRFGYMHGSKMVEDVQARCWGLLSLTEVDFYAKKPSWTEGCVIQ
jgi:hypothetical protein